MRPLSEAPRDGTPIFLLTYRHGTLIGWYSHIQGIPSLYPWAYIFNFKERIGIDADGDPFDYIPIDFIAEDAIRGWLPLDIPLTPIH